LRIIILSGFVGSLSMCNRLVALVLLAGSYTFAFAQAQSATPAGDSGQKSSVAMPVIVIHGVLPRGLNSKSATARPTFVVKTADPLKLSNGTVIPVDSDVTGHVLQSAARSNGAQESTLTLTFDTLQPKGSDKALPIRGIIQAITGPEHMVATP